MRRDEFKRRMDSLWWEQSMTDTPRTEKVAQTVEYSADDFEHGLLVEVVDADFARQLEVELAVAMTRLELWRERAFAANASEEMVEIDELIGELTEMRRAYEEGNK